MIFPVFSVLGVSLPIASRILRFNRCTFGIIHKSVRLAVRARDYSYAWLLQSTNRFRIRSVILWVVRLRRRESVTDTECDVESTKMSLESGRIFKQTGSPLSVQRVTSQKSRRATSITYSRSLFSVHCNMQDISSNMRITPLLLPQTYHPSHTAL